MIIRPKRYIAFREPTGEVLICDVNEDGEWIGGTEARYDSWDVASYHWNIQPRSKERTVPFELSEGITRRISHLCSPR